MNNLEHIKQAMQEYGAKRAIELQEKAKTMTGTEMYEEIDSFPLFPVAIKTKNMKDRAVGFTCRTSEGYIARLIENYDSTEKPEEPEFIPLYYKFFYSTDPSKAKPFIIGVNSPYMTGECCIEKSIIYFLF